MASAAPKTKEQVTARPRSPAWRLLPRQSATAAALLAAAVTAYLALDRAFDLPPYALQFRSETVRATPRGQTVTFDGEYHFLARHRARRTYTVAFPFRVGAFSPAPSMIEAARNGQPLPFTQSAEGIEFELEAAPGQETTVTIRYTLPAPDKRATYIARTANLWPMPLEKAVFIVPDGVQSNYHAGTADRTTVEFEQFRPRDDWRISWR